MKLQMIHLRLVIVLIVVFARLFHVILGVSIPNNMKSGENAKLKRSVPAETRVRPVRQMVFGMTHDEPESFDSENEEKREVNKEIISDEEHTDLEGVHNRVVTGKEQKLWRGNGDRGQHNEFSGHKR